MTKLWDAAGLCFKPYIDSCWPTAPTHVTKHLKNDDDATSPKSDDRSGRRHRVGSATHDEHEDAKELTHKFKTLEVTPGGEHEEKKLLVSPTSDDAGSLDEQEIDQNASEFYLKFLDDECQKHPAKLVKALLTIFRGMRDSSPTLYDEVTQACIDKLLTCDVDEIVDDKKSTALHSAALFGYDWVCEVLIAGGASPGLVDGGGLTPLHYAANRFNKMRNKHTCKILIAAIFQTTKKPGSVHDYIVRFKDNPLIDYALLEEAFAEVEKMVSTINNEA